MKDYEVIIKDKEGNIINTSVKTLEIRDDEIKVISFVCDDHDIGGTIGNILRVKLEDMGLKNFLIMPIQDKDHEISIKTIKIDN